jgi:hypothetical protein
LPSPEVEAAPRDRALPQWPAATGIALEMSVSGSEIPHSPLRRTHDQLT